MKKLKTSKSINLKKLSSTAKDELLQNMYAAHSQIFDGVDRETFRRYVLEADALINKAWLFRNLDGETVGYITFQVFKTDEQKNVRVIRTQVGMLKEYRGSNQTLKILARESTRFYLKNFFRKMYFVATPVHPNPYCVAARQMYSMYPHPHRPTPGKIQSLMDQISRSLHLGEEEENSLIKKVGWVVKDRSEQRRRILESKDEFVRYYLSQNPDYTEGKGMLMLVPICIMNGVWTLKSLFSRKLRRSRVSRAGVQPRGKGPYVPA